MPEMMPTRAAGLERLEAFVPRAGKAYASGRNFDRGPGAHDRVSLLSPYIRHRLVLEREVLEAVAERFAINTAEKFVSEVYWRTYFKGFLERRPTIWQFYRNDLAALRESLEKDGRLAADVAAAEEGRTGIDAFDHWATELKNTGYLHNHARMWFASIWIFTLRLPWQLGADFFLRHLLDGDPASNTLSWRWVGGLHTKGRTYLARRDNIERYTEGRFCPSGLAGRAEPLTEDVEHALRPVPQGDEAPSDTVFWLVTEEDCADDPPPLTFAGLAATANANGRSDEGVAPGVLDFTRGAVGDALARYRARLGLSGGSEREPQPIDGETLVRAAQDAGVTTIATRYLPVGPAADALAAARPVLREAGLSLAVLQRPEDGAAWHYADKGFFKVKKAIPKLLAA